MFSFTSKPEIREYIYTYVLDKLADTGRRLVVSKKIINDIMGWYYKEKKIIDEPFILILLYCSLRCR